MSDGLIRLFVYGTLRINRANYAAIARYVVDIEPATVRGILLDMGSFPAMVPGTGIVEGELLTVQPEVLRITDRIEGVAHGFYQRRRVKARRQHGSVVWAWAYFYANPTKIADYPRLIIDYQNSVPVFAWRRFLGDLAPQLTAAEYCFFERVGEAARRGDLTSLGRLINKAPSRRMRGHCIEIFAIHHAHQRRNRRVAMRLMRMVAAAYVDEWEFMRGVHLYRAVVESALTDPGWGRQILGDQ
jgi:gamma-glutamylcyclotransferase (GGCT)/AIG2-like uncharacterized protein YtfP